MQLRQGRALDRTVVISTAHRDYAFLASVGVNYQPMKTRRNHLISLRQQKNGRRVTRFGIRNTVEVPWNLQGNWAREQPEIPPAKLAQNYLPQRGRIVQDQSGNRPRRRYVEFSGAAEACAIDHNWSCVGVALQFIKRGERSRADPRESRRS